MLMDGNGNGGSGDWHLKMPPNHVMDFYRKRCHSYLRWPRVMVHRITGVERREEGEFEIIEIQPTAISSE